MAWQGMHWRGKASHGVQHVRLARHDTARHGIARHDMHLRWRGVGAGEAAGKALKPVVLAAMTDLKAGVLLPLQGLHMMRLCPASAPRLWLTVSLLVDTVHLRHGSWINASLTP